MTPEEIHQVLQSLRSNPNLDTIEEVCAEISEHIDDNSFVRPLMDIIENNKDFDFGSPGIIVHTIEKYFKNGYESALLESCLRSPTILSVWMLRRIINGMSTVESYQYIDAMRLIATNQNLDEDIRKFAEEML